jgi:SAM-dependent methyltransferase
MGRPSDPPRPDLAILGNWRITCDAQSCAVTDTDDKVPSPAKGWRSRIADNRRRMDTDLAGDPDARKRLSPVLFGLSDRLTPRLRQRARGQFLDAGCGAQPFRVVVEPLVDRYTTLDIEARVERVDYLGDVQDMKAVPGDAFDSVLCSEVLEHVPHPAQAVAELARVLKPGGTLVITVPFLARLHEEPHDYYRYTRHGLRALLEDGSFVVEEIVETGSLFSFIGHQISVAVLGLTWHLGPLRQVAIVLNAALVVRPAVTIDRLVGLSRLLPLGYVVVATRSPAGAGEGNG